MMVYLNTKKELFLGKRKFSAKKMNKEEFLKQLNILLLSNGFSEIISLNHDDLRTFYDCLCECEYFESLDIEVPGAGIYIQDYEDEDGQMEFCETENGFCYIELYTSIGDDAGRPLYNILYFDENGILQVYIPFCGNLVNVNAKLQLFTYGGDDADSYEYLVEKYDSYLRSKYKRKTDFFIENEVDVILVECLGLEYGLEGSLPNIISGENTDNFIYDVHFHKKYLKEDILSNVNIL